jgi:hypothetical protein
MKICTLGPVTACSAMLFALASLQCGSPPNRSATVQPGPSAAVRQDGPLYLTVRLQDNFNPDFIACVPVRVDEPFTVSWVQNGDRNIISGALHRPEAGKYPLELKTEEWHGGKPAFLGHTRPALKLDEPFVTDFSIRLITLSADACK